MQLRLIVPISVVALSLAATNCDNAKSETEPPPPREAPATAQLPATTNGFKRSPHFERVMNRLDVGGKMLRFQDHAGRRESISKLTSAFIEHVSSLDLDGQVKIDSLVDKIGLLDAVATGRSLRKDGDSWLFRYYSHLPKGRRGVHKLLGGEASPFEAASQLPATTDLLIESRLDASKLTGLFRELAEFIDAGDDLEDSLAAEFTLGTTYELLLSTIDLRLILAWDLSRANGNPEHLDFVLQLDGSKNFSRLIAPKIKELFGEPKIVGNRKVWNAVSEKLEVKVEMDDGTTRIGKVLLDQDGRVTLVSGLDYLKRIETNSPRLLDEKHYRGATNHFPQEGNVLVYSSPNMSKLIPEIASSWLEQYYPIDSDFPAKLDKILVAQPWSFCLAYERDGLAITGELPVVPELSLGAILPVLSLNTVKAASLAVGPGPQRAQCIMNIRNVQQGVRSFKNMNGLRIGTPLDWEEVIGPDKFLEKMPVCPSGGKYTFSKNHPKVGELACKCSLAEKKGHVPLNHGDW